MERPVRRVWVGSRRPGLVTQPQPGGVRPGAPTPRARSALPSFRLVSGSSLGLTASCRLLRLPPALGAALRRSCPPASPAHPHPALSVRVGRCRYGSPSVGAGQRPAKALASLRPLSGAFRPLLPAAALCRCPCIGPAVAELPRAALSVASAGCGWPGRQGVGGLEASCALPLSGHTTPMVPAAHPRHAKRVTAAECDRPGEDSASLWHPAPGFACHGSHGQSACGSGWPLGRPARFFRSQGWVETGKKLLFCAEEGIWMKRDVYQAVTTRIMDALQQGVSLAEALGCPDGAAPQSGERETVSRDECLDTRRAGGFPVLADLSPGPAARRPCQSGRAGDDGHLLESAGQAGTGQDAGEPARSRSPAGLRWPAPIPCSTPASASCPSSGASGRRSRPRSWLRRTESRRVSRSWPGCPSGLRSFMLASGRSTNPARIV